MQQQRQRQRDPQPQQHRQHDVIISQRPAVSPIRSPTARPNNVDDVEAEALSRAVARFMMGQYTRAHAQARRDNATASLASADEQRRIVAAGFEAFLLQLPRLADDLETGAVHFEMQVPGLPGQFATIPALEARKRFAAIRRRALIDARAVIQLDDPEHVAGALVHAPIVQTMGGQRQWHHGSRLAALDAFMNTTHIFLYYHELLYEEELHADTHLPQRRLFVEPCPRSRARSMEP